LFGAEELLERRDRRARCRSGGGRGPQRLPRFFHGHGVADITTRCRPVRGARPRNARTRASVRWSPSSH